MLNKSLIRFIVGAVLLGWGMPSCKKSAYSTQPPPSTPVINTKLTTNASLGAVITDSAGNTLYFFSLDANGNSACTGGCLTTWPVFYTSSVIAGTGLDVKDFGSITRSDGSKQTTYKSWPLYYFQNDSKAGDVKGEGIENIWFVAKPDYTVMLANTQLIGKDGVSYDSTYKPGTGITQYLTDDRGVTLYSFTIDKANKNNYTAADFSNDAVWPIYQAKTPLVAPSIIDQSLLTMIDVFGKRQLVFKGWPIYYFGEDAGKRGSTKGVSVPTPGIWPVVNQYSVAAPQ